MNENVLDLYIIVWHNRDTIFQKGYTMAILVDYNQVMLASLFASIGNHHNAEISEDMIRHMFLNSLRASRMKFYQEYGEMIICTDGKNSWRKTVFPYYKANRKKTREESELNWTLLFGIMANIREELDEFFPYKVIHFDSVEADDIIGTISHECGSILENGSEKILVLSGDKDFVQLQKYANITQYDPVRKKWIKNSNPEQYLKEHVLKGDSGDGIPNIVSDDNSLVIGKRQKPMTAKRIAIFGETPNVMSGVEHARWERNKVLIDLELIPEMYKEKILEKYYEPKDVGRKKLYKYFIEKGLKNLMTDIGDF